MVNVEMDGGIKTYLAEIGRTPLLNREEEADLSQKIQKMRLCVFQETVQKIAAIKEGETFFLDLEEFEIVREHFTPKEDEEDEEDDEEIPESENATLEQSIYTTVRKMGDAYRKLEKKDGKIVIASNLPKLLIEFQKTYKKVVIKNPETVKEVWDKARAHMIRANLRLVVKIAQDYANYWLPLLDLISEGNMGLMKSVERFDPNKGGKLSTYAAWWIKQAIKRALANQGKTIRLPVHMIDKISQMHRTVNILTGELWREPDDQEVAEALGITGKDLKKIRGFVLHLTSLDAPISDDDTTTFGEIIGDDKQEDPADALELADGLKISQDLLDVLDERERTIIEKRFWLGGKKPMTLDEVGQEFGVTRERIRQLQNIALKKLRRALEKKENPIPGSRRWMWRPEENLLPNDGEDIELEEGDEDTKTERSPTLTPAFLQAARTQLASIQPKKSRQPRQKKPTNGVPKEEKTETLKRANTPPALTPDERERLGKLLLHVSSGEGRIICDKDQRINMLDLYLGRGGAHRSVAQIANIMHQSEVDIRTTLTGMASIFLSK
jgi:RNA polymerase primary sigma factor